MPPRENAYSTLLASHIVVMAASAGGVETVTEILSKLPPDFPAAIVIAQHLPSAESYLSQLCEVLGRRSKLPVKWIDHGEPLYPGVVYLCPQDMQSRVSRDMTFNLSVAVRTRRSSPLADPLFTSVAEVFGEHALAIVLTGSLSDGACGATAISAAGGRVFAQNQETARFFDMPQAAIRNGVVDFVLSPLAIAHALVALLMVPGAGAWFRVSRVYQVSNS